MNTPLVDQLEYYPWSSYPVFIGKAKAVNWLTREYTYQLLGYPHKYKHYRNFIMLGNDPDAEKFYGKENCAAVLATDTFKQWVYETLLLGLSGEVKVMY
jgi:hypothetical protein